MRIRQDQLLNSLPPEWPVDLLSTIKTRVRESSTKVIVLDDDPTGTQTVHNVPVLTKWSNEYLVMILTESTPVVYILTNSRSVPISYAQEMNREIARNLRYASNTTGRNFVVVSRSDSTLRGHFPGEVEALINELDQDIDGILIIPFFLEGGRITVNDIHYVLDKDHLIPAADTEFAQDAVFGYRNSNLRDWVSEKYQDKVKSQEVASISISEIRTGGPEAVAHKLDSLGNRQICVVNAASYRDIEVLVAGLLGSESNGKRFLYRSAASFVRVRGGISPRDLLIGTDLSDNKEKLRGGLVIVGSYVQKTTTQIKATSSLSKVTQIEISVEKVLNSARREAEINRVSNLANASISKGDDVVVYTSRHLFTTADKLESLRVGQKISQALVDVVGKIEEEPAWLIAKGGITSSDVATKGLNIERAQVLGQAIPGVPVWRTGKESRWPGMVYVVFPGNVGGPSALADMIRILRN
jgi:uncharacterized protein YgbK (DUF1537 family)